MKSLSVIVCTYNPNPVVFGKCLLAIKAACGQLNPFEIIIIDNNSNPPLADENYISSFLTDNIEVRLIVETKPGLTPARLRGIKEATGEILLFIDDDNFITINFFAKGMAIADFDLHIGAWSGQVKLIFETHPEEWTRQYWGLLVHREFDKAMWSNLPNLADTMPCGAGMFVRKEVAFHYLSLHEEGKRNIQLDRTGSSLFSGGDNDLAACACDIGLGVGLFHQLILEHYIPKKRLEKKYLLNLAAGITASAIVLRSFRNDFPRKRSLKNKLAQNVRLLMKNKIDRDFYQAVLKGEQMGLDILKSNEI